MGHREVTMVFFLSRQECVCVRASAWSGSGSFRQFNLSSRRQFCPTDSHPALPQDKQSGPQFSQFASSLQSQNMGNWLKDTDTNSWRPARVAAKVLADYIKKPTENHCTVTFLGYPFLPLMWGGGSLGLRGLFPPGPSEGS